ncbi:hypothetical protein TNCV_2365621 [Trichonephila clavipes]|nr:hypothetical protein TNCV_2365621 [Trichonephila clavipes]
MEKDPLLTIAISSSRTAVENVELSLPVQHNASLDGNFRISHRKGLFSRYCWGETMSQSLSKSTGFENRLRQKNPTFICKEDTTPLIRCLVFVLLTPL